MAGAGAMACVRPGTGSAADWWQHERFGSKSRDPASGAPVLLVRLAQSLHQLDKALRRMRIYGYDSAQYTLQSSVLCQEHAEQRDELDAARGRGSKQHRQQSVSPKRSPWPPCSRQSMAL